MSLDSSNLEARLKDLSAAELDDALLARLDACAHETWTELSPAETAYLDAYHAHVRQMLMERVLPQTRAFLLAQTRPVAERRAGCPAADAAVA